MPLRPGYLRRPSPSSLDAVDVLNYGYDKSDRLTKVSQNDTRWAYYYDGAGLLSREELWVSGDHNQAFALTYERNSTGYVSRVTYPSGRKVDMELDGHGRTIAVPGYVSEATYHLNGQLETFALENGTSHSISLDDRLRPRQRIVRGSRETILSQTTDYDARSNVTKISDYFAPSGVDLRNLAYDGLSRLLGADGVWGRSSYTFDEVGNLRYVSISGRSEVYGYDSSNRLVSTFSGKNGSRVIAYDENGNIRLHGNRTYRFDGSNRLIKSIKHDKDDDEAPIDVLFTQTNLYDGRGMRVATTTKQTVEERQYGADVVRSNESTTFFVYNRAGELMHEYDLESRESRDHIRLDGKTIAVVGRHKSHDTDKDGMPDYFERLYGLSTLLTSDAHADNDGDGRTNLQEYQSGSNPLATDTDHDGISDIDDPDHALPGWARPAVLEPIFTFLGG